VLDNEVVFFDDGVYDYVALVNAGQINKAWIGLNEQGFAILNSLSYNLADSLTGGWTNGELMKKALQVCATVDDFELLLAQTNNPGRNNPANLAVLDAYGGGAMFEAGNRSWRRFDVDDPTVAPEGFLARANFSLSADTSGVDRYRYDRCRHLLQEAVDADGVDITWMLSRVSRDLCTAKIDPYPLPYEGTPPGYPDAFGYVDATNTINRRSSAAGGVVLGVRPDEDPFLSTFYAMVGHPVVTIALPVWVTAGPTPDELDGLVTSPVCDLALSRKADCYDHSTNSSLINTFHLVDDRRISFLGLVERVERWLLPQVQQHLDEWREDGVDPEEMSTVEEQLAHEAFIGYKGGPLYPPQERVGLLVTPNPMRSNAVIRYQLEDPPPNGWAVDIVSVDGRLVRRLQGCRDDTAVGCIYWDGHGTDGREVASGVYFLRPSWPTQRPIGSIVVSR
jgi:hypothetical protein